jgi:hypothetical protein
MVYCKKGLFYSMLYNKGLAAQWGLAENVDFFDINSSHYVSQFKFRGTVVLPGILSMGYFSHSGISTLMKDNQYQNKNGRDLGIAYFLVFLTYVILVLYFISPILVGKIA